MNLPINDIKIYYFWSTYLLENVFDLRLLRLLRAHLLNFIEFLLRFTTLDYAMLMSTVNVFTSL
jgi:hypothetical protein